MKATRSHVVPFQLLRRHPARRIAGRLRRTLTTAPSTRNIDSILIANRGEIALRVNKTASQHGIRTGTVYTDPDALSQHAHSSPLAFNLGSTSAYLDQEKILSLAQEHGFQAIHPGYGFLSENADFARKCASAGVKFIGPPPTAIDDMGDKARSKKIMTDAGVPCVPGYHGTDQASEHLAQEAEAIGYPVLIKAVRGGGGKGMRIVRIADEFQEMLVSAKSESKSSFGNDDVLIEKYITTPRHIEVQVFADTHGNCVALGERDCSIQRRHQKILEESPAPHLDDTIRKDLWAKARAAALAVNYEGAGTVEFIFDNDSGEFFFMEMNTRLQVEHPVTEMVTGLDLVHWQILVADGKPLPLTQDQVEQRISTHGHAIEARIYAENPEKGFIPDSGRLLHVRTPTESADVRIDSGFVQGDEVSSHYDPMIAKLIVRSHDRETAVQKMASALDQYEVAGPITNIEFLKRICRSEDFLRGEVETGYIEKHREELFRQKDIPAEVLIEAALYSFFTTQATQESRSEPARPITGPLWLMANSEFHPRLYSFDSADQTSNTEKRPPHTVTLLQKSPNTFTAHVTSSSSSPDPLEITSTYHPTTSTLTTYYPHTRLTSHIISSPLNPLTNTSTITIHTPLGLHRLHPTPPAFLNSLASTSVTNSLLSPMPCKILRVHVRPGDVVKKDQALLVIESMKMETVVRSPGEGLKVKRVRFGEGEVVGAGVGLVEFEAEEEEEEGKGK